MEDPRIAKLQDANLLLGKELVNLASEVAELRAHVNVLSVYVATQLSPDDPALGIKQIVELAKQSLVADKDAPVRQKAVDIADALLAWRKRGKPPIDS